MASGILSLVLSSLCRCKESGRSLGKTIMQPSINNKKYTTRFLFPRSFFQLQSAREDDTKERGWWCWWKRKNKEKTSSFVTLHNQLLVLIIVIIIIIIKKEGKKIHSKIVEQQHISEKLKSIRLLTMLSAFMLNCFGSSLGGYFFQGGTEMLNKSKVNVIQ